MKKILLFITAVIIAVLLISNPTKKDFKTYLKMNISKIIQKKINLSESVSKYIVDKVGGIIPKEADYLIKQENYYIFSIYTIDFSIIGSSKYKLKFIGIFKKFAVMD